MSPSPIIEFQNVHRHFADHRVLRGLSFRIEEGQAFALLGRNGCGKSTALKILLGFLEPHRGEARILGVPSRELTPQLRDQIGYVGEEHALNNAMRVRQILDYECATRQRFERRIVESGLRRLGVDLDKFVSQLSRGQRATLVLLIAVAQQPRVLVFDDPALGLDVVMRRELIEVLLSLLAEHGITLLFSSHVMQDVERIASRVGILHHGRMIVDASLDDLRSRLRKRFIRTHQGANVNGSFVDALPEVLRHRRVRDGYELLLIDETRETMERMTRFAASISDPLTASLEDLLAELTTDGPLDLLESPKSERGES